MDSPLIDTIDMEILMHRDAHFGGNFEMMIEYYQKSGVGAIPDFDIEEIKRLEKLERELEENLSDIYLTDSAKAMIKNSKKLYASLREVYSDNSKDPIPMLVSDLIFSEEAVPEAEMNALIAQKGKAVPALIHLLSAPSFYEPLFPGYGRSPIFAAKCLGEIQDDRAIPPLFEAIGHENFFTDEEMIYALRMFGDQAKTFLIKRLKAKPLSKDNDYAIIALSVFPKDPEIASCALEMLQDEETFKRPSFGSYLIFACINLTDLKEKEAFIDLSKQKKVPKMLRDEMQLILKEWKMSI